MHPRLEYLYERIESQRQKLLQPLLKLSNEKLNGHPTDKWSINQIVAHLIAAERLSVGYISKKIQGIETLADTGLVDELKMVLLVLSQRLPLKFKAPKVVVENTTQENDLKKLEEEWDTVRADLKKLLEQIEDDQVRRKILKHVRMGMINIQHTLRFFGEHVGHHKPQIDVLLR